MHRVRLHDDGSTVRLDLHSATVTEAESLMLRAADQALDRGRSTLVLVHGASSSERLYRNDTIKHRLYALLDEGRLPGVASVLKKEGETVIGLATSARRDPERLSLDDVQPPW